MLYMSSAIENPAAMQFAARRPLQPERTALIVIDIQEKLLPPIWERERLVRNSQLLLRLASVLPLPVTATTQYVRGLGPTVPEIASLLPPETVAYDKLQFSCFGSEQFCDALRALPGDRDSLLLCGMEAHICVLQTALEGLRRGYLVHVVADAVSSRSEQNWRLGLDRMRDAGAVISSTEMAIYELLRASGSLAFKAMLPHLKEL
jgi:nicotinamidase-related amidase